MSATGNVIIGFMNLERTNDALRIVEMARDVFGLKTGELVLPQTPDHEAEHGVGIYEVEVTASAAERLKGHKELTGAWPVEHSDTRRVGVCEACVEQDTQRRIEARRAGL